MKHLAHYGLSRFKTDGHDETDLDDSNPVLSLTKTDSNAINTFNNDDDVMD